MKKTPLSVLVMIPMMMSHFALVFNPVREPERFKILMDTHLFLGLAYYFAISCALMFAYMELVLSDYDDPAPGKQRVETICYYLKLLTCVGASSVGFFMMGFTLGMYPMGVYRVVGSMVAILAFFVIMGRYFSYFIRTDINARE